MSNNNTTTNSNATEDAEYRAKVKDSSRAGRLSFRNRAEQLLRYDMKNEAIEKCKPDIGKFAECANREGLLVVFRCKEQQKLMNACMEVHNGPEAWEKYKQEHQKELEVRAAGQKYV